MMVLITYDVSVTDYAGQKRLRKVAKQCQNYGVRVQNSVFECSVEPAQYEKMKNELSKIINKNTDSLRFYLLGKNWQKKIVHIGAKETIDVENDSLIF